jgi:hypothetical protein
MSDLRTFSRRIRTRAGRVNKNTDNLVKKVILAVDQAVVLATPVDTGRARANWRPSIGAMVTSTLPEPKSPGEGLRTAIAAGEDIANKYIGGNNSPHVHITNNLPYIQYLNQGSSKQAPANFVNTAILLAISAIRSARIIDIR